MQFVFISYSTKDAEVVKAVCHQLEASGIRCWMAPRDISPGLDWRGQISAAIRNSSAFLLIFSRNSNDSEDVVKEVALAAKRKIPIVPFRIEVCDLCDSLAYEVGNRHWLDALTLPLQQHVEKLIKVVHSLFELAAKMEGNDGGARVSAPEPSPVVSPPLVAQPVRTEARPRPGRNRRGALVALGVVAVAAGYGMFLHFRTVPVDDKSSQQPESGVQWQTVDFSPASGITDIWESVTFNPVDPKVLPPVKSHSALPAHSKVSGNYLTYTFSKDAGNGRVIPPEAAMQTRATLAPLREEFTTPAVPLTAAELPAFRRPNSLSAEELDRALENDVMQSLLDEARRPQQLTHEGFALLKKNDLAAAKIKFQEALKASGGKPGASLASYGIERCDYERQSYDAVIDTWRWFLTEEDYNGLDEQTRAEVYLMAGCAYAAVDKHNPAERTFRFLEKLLNCPDSQVRRYCAEAGFRRIVSLFKLPDPAWVEAADEYLKTWQGGDNEQGFTVKVQSLRDSSRKGGWSTSLPPGDYSVTWKPRDASLPLRDGGRLSVSDSHSNVLKIPGAAP